MGVKDTWKSLGIRAKINLILIPALIPMLAIATITYNSYRDSMLKNSERLMELIVRNETEKANDFLTAQAAVFEDWTKEDIFGLAIEFDTTKEVGEQFQRMMAGAPGFSMLCLTNKDGKIMQAAVGSGSGTIKADSVIGRTAPEAKQMGNADSRSIIQSKSNFLKDVGFSFPKTYVLGFPCKDSSGNLNGHLIAYVDWAVLQNRTLSANEMLKGNGFTDARATILDAQAFEAQTHSDVALLNTNLELGDSLGQWMRIAENSKKTSKFAVGDSNEFVTFAPVIGPIGLAIGGEDALAKSPFRLAAFVPEDNVMSAVQRVLWFSVGIVGIGVVGLLGVFWFMSQNISKQLGAVIVNLTEGGKRVAAASSQVSEASQQMARGASEQASGLEEASSSLEEMSSMTKQNADNAKQANTLANDARGATGKGQEAMARMSEAINKIKGSSDETAKIVKTIDEIAFQTNLLALNAAVEAARAGEAGKGFAVVAEEVRNLAQRSAEAAKTTSELIEGSQKNADNGVAVSGEVEGILKQIADGVQKVSDLIAEVSAASDEQSQGIDQVNSAVAQMDSITQSNAANSEESASSSNELAGQARELNEMVGVLIGIVGGNRAQTNGSMTSHVSAPKAREQKNLGAAPGILQDAAITKKAPEKVTAKIDQKVVKPEEVIPMDGGEFGKN